MYETVLKIIIGAGAVVSAIVIAALWAAVTAEKETERQWKK